MHIKNGVIEKTSSINRALRAWLGQLIGNGRAREVDALMKRLKHIDAGGHYTRDEMNRR